MNRFSAGIIWDPREPQLVTNYVAMQLAPVLPGIGRLAEDEPTPDTRPYKRMRAMKELPTKVIIEPDRKVLPAVSISINARVTGDIAEVTVKQMFLNDADLPIKKGSYAFSLPDGCTVMGFTCRIGKKKVLRATARPKNEAQEAFQKAVSSHATAALLDQETSEIFTTSLGNIPPNTQIKTEITYATILKHRFGEGVNAATLIIPTYIANRYGDRPTSLRGLELETKPDDISLRIEILQAVTIQSIKSISHEIVIERDKTLSQVSRWDQLQKSYLSTEHEVAYVRMKDSTTCLETDFILSIDTAGSDGSNGLEAWLEVHPVFENQAAMMLTLPPHTDDAEHGEIIFVVDRSGSMEDKMANVKSAMNFFLKGIPLGRTFNIWCFGSNFQPLWSQSQVYGQGSLNEALDYVNTKFRADMGGTELLPVLESIVAIHDSLNPCDVVVLTDGEVWKLDETLNLVRTASESSKGVLRFSSFGLGDHVSHALIEGIAKNGGGYSEVVLRANKEGWEDRLVAMLKAVLTIHTSDIKLDLCGIKAMISPDNFRSFSQLEQNRIFLLLDRKDIPKPEEIKLKIVSDGTDVPFRISTTILESPGTIIHNMAAHAILTDIERAKSLKIPYTYGGCSEAKGDSTELSHFAEQLACKYSLLSERTSLFLVEETDKRFKGETISRHIAEISIFRQNDSLLRDYSLGRLTPAFNTAAFNKVSHHRDSRKILPQIVDSYRDPGYEETADHRVPIIQPSVSRVPIAQPSAHSDSGDVAGFYFSKKRSERYTYRKCSILSKMSAQADFILVVLDHQAFDGSIGEGVVDWLRTEAQEIIQKVKDWLCEKTQLSGATLNLTSTTALAISLLEQEFQSRKDFWVMIYEKALDFIGRQLIQLELRNDLMDYAKKMLKTVDGPVGVKREASYIGLGGSVSVSISESSVPVQGGGSIGVDRVLIHQAPTD